ncbi:MAG: hypothetical protein U1F52_17525 [Burkholderiales bacterium]
MKNRTKAKIRADGEHAFHVIERVFGLVEVSCRRLEKNADRVIFTGALASLYTVRRTLRPSGASSARSGSSGH